MFRVGEEVGIAKLRKTYDQYANSVLGLYLDELPREGKKQRRFKVRQDMPSVDEYLRLKSTRYSTTVESLVDEAYAEIECLAEEMRERFDNMPENLQGGDIGCRVEEAADALEGIDRVDYPDDLSEITTVFYPTLNCDSRADRAAEAASQLRHAVDVLREWQDEQTVKANEDGSEEEVDPAIAAEFADELENHADELEGVDFPGMYS